jgi:hypothetical protein
LKKIIKKRLIDLLLKLLEQQEVQQWRYAEYAKSKKSLPALANIPHEYFSTEPQTGEQGEGVIFISSRFRSGSTLLWNIFRNAEGYTSLYEPFNERQWFNPKTRGDGVDSTHRGVTDYWREYQNMEDLTPLYNEDWIRSELLLDDKSHNPAMKQFIDKMIELSPNRPVLQFNRIDFRLPWLKAQYPKAKFIHLYRHPRDQWCSFLTDKQKMNKDDVQHTYEDGFYLNSWCHDLSQHFPFLSAKQTPHPYMRFYYLWKLSYLYGKQYSDLSISYESLVTDTENVLADMLALVGDEVSDAQELSKLIDVTSVGAWRRYADEGWFSQMEARCESTLY